LNLISSSAGACDGGNEGSSGGMLALVGVGVVTGFVVAIAPFVDAVDAVDAAVDAAAVDAAVDAVILVGGVSWSSSSSLK